MFDFDFWFKFWLVVGLILAQAVFWSWVGLTATRRLRNWSLRQVIADIWRSMTEWATNVYPDPEDRRFRAR